MTIEDTEAMAQCFRAHTVLTLDLSLVPSDHAKQHTIICNSSSRGYVTLLWTLQASALICIDKHINLKQYITIIKSKNPKLPQKSKEPRYRGPRSPLACDDAVGWWYFPSAMSSDCFRSSRLYVCVSAIARIQQHQSYVFMCILTGTCTLEIHVLLA